ncbi:MULTISPECIES: hypothetical protein [Haloprofundus]|uniref:hypothetical protein n=1 Tax=Haloprofundus TaxID=1911573 RepID=UPI0018E5554E|nr:MULTISPECIES: hypothetical protein [Haloprofundus]
MYDDRPAERVEFVDCLVLGDDDRIARAGHRRGDAGQDPQNYGGHEDHYYH